MDWVVLDRIINAIDTGDTATFHAPVPEDERHLYYRELAYMGYAPTAIQHATGWNVNRMQRTLRERGQRRVSGPLPTAPIYLDAHQVDVNTRPGAIVLRIDGRLIIVEDTPRNLTALGRLVYGAANAQHEEISA